MKRWILLAIFMLVLLLATRERFEATPLIKDPATWDNAEIQRIRNLVVPASTLSDSEIRTIIGGFFPRWKAATYRITTADINQYASGQMASLPSNKKAEVRGLLEAYYIDQGQSVFEQAAGYVSGFLGQDTSGQYTPPTCPTGYTLADDGTGKCKSGNNPPIDPECPSGYTLTFDNPPRCRNPAPVPAGPAPGPGTGPEPVTSATTGTTAFYSGTTTGGSSTAALGPTNQTTSKQGGVWGPLLVGKGTPTTTGTGGGNGSSTGQYPELMGGLGDQAPTALVNGVGVVSAGRALAWTPPGAVGPENVLPSDLLAKADPYRLSRSFSSASYASKEEPAPFLTDFSPFQK